MAIEKVIDIKIESNAEQSVGTLKQQFKEAVLQVQNLTEAYGANSKQAIEAAKRAGEIKDKIEDANDAIKSFKGEGTFLATSKALSSVASGFAAVQGAQSLFGSQSKEVEQTLLKVQSAMALSQGLAGLEDAGRSFKQLATVAKSYTIVQKVLTAATAAYTFVTQASTTGLKLFRAALIGTGIGAIVVGLGLLIANFDKVKETIMKVIPGLSSVSKVIGGIVNSITDFVGATSDATRALDKLKENADKTLSVNKKFMQEHGDQVDEYTKKKIDAKNAYAEAVKEDGANEAALAKKLNRELAAIEYSRGDEKRKIQKEANDKAAAERKSNIEKDAAQRKTDLEKEEQDEQKSIDEHNKAISDLNKRYDEEKENRLADTAVKKENLDYRRGVLEIEKLAKTELEKQTLIEKLNAEHRERLAIATKTDEEKIAEELKKVNDKKVADAKEATDKQIAVEKTLTDAKRNALDTGLGLLLQFAGKNKAVALTILAIQKGLAIADIVVGASKAIALASSNLAAVPAFIGVVPNPAYIGQAIATAKGIISTKISAASSIASILASGISTAASITGGGASSGGTSGGGGATGATAPTPPSFNVVGSSSTNQLAQTIGQQQQQPIQAYVVANNVTTAQSLQRNIIESATIGG